MKDKYNGQICQDDELNEKFRNLHYELVDRVIKFCKENNIEIDSLNLSADGLANSIKCGHWTLYTDSSFILEDESNAIYVASM